MILIPLASYLQAKQPYIGISGAGGKMKKKEEEEAMIMSTLYIVCTASRLVMSWSGH